MNDGIFNGEFLNVRIVSLGAIYVSHEKVAKLYSPRSRLPTMLCHNNMLVILEEKYEITIEADLAWLASAFLIQMLWEVLVQLRALHRLTCEIKGRKESTSKLKVLRVPKRYFFPWLVLSDNWRTPQQHCNAKIGIYPESPDIVLSRRATGQGTPKRKSGTERDCAKWRTRLELRMNKR